MCHHYDSRDWAAIRSRIEAREAATPDEADEGADLEETDPAPDPDRDEVATPADD